MAAGECCSTSTPRVAVAVMYALAFRDTNRVQKFYRRFLEFWLAWVTLKRTVCSTDHSGMSLFQWNDSLSIGNGEIDSQHKKLFALADRFHAAMSGGHGKAILQQTLTELIDYTRHHFACEESVMQKSAYPQFPQHKAEHDKLTQKVVKLHGELVAGHAVITIDVLQFLRDWLIHHIGEMDKKVGQHLRQVKSAA